MDKDKKLTFDRKTGELIIVDATPEIEPEKLKTVIRFIKGECIVFKEPISAPVQPYDIDGEKYMKDANF